MVVVFVVVTEENTAAAADDDAAAAAAVFLIKTEIDKGVVGVGSSSSSIRYCCEQRLMAMINGDD